MPRDLWDSRDAMKRAARERLTPAEWAWVYHPPLLVLLYVALVVLAATLAEAAAVAIACLAAARMRRRRRSPGSSPRAALGDEYREPVVRPVPGAEVQPGPV